MSAQPANTSISVFRNVRTQRNIVRHDSVAAIIKHLRPLVAVKPGEEINVGVLTRDSNVSDFSPYMGQAAAGATRGFPVVIGVLPTATFGQLQGISTADTVADFAFQIGSDKFVAATAATLSSEDLFAEAKAIN